MSLLTDIIIIFGLSVLVIFFCHRVRIPPVVGFLVTGVLAGPKGLGLITAVHEVETLAEIGVVFLLFTIGIEFSVKSLLQIKRSVLLGGCLQVGLTILAVFAVLKGAGREYGASVFGGFLISLSSTAVVLRLLQEKAQMESPHGRATLGILIFQDIIIVPMILITPILAGGAEQIGWKLLTMLGEAAAIIVAVVLCSQWVVPVVFYHIVRTRSRELFLLSIVGMCLAVAWLTNAVGLSLALGAFLAGLVISESEYSHEALGNVLPFRDVLTSFFFVSIGMLLDVPFLLQHPGTTLLVAAGVILLKALVAMVAGFFLGFPFRTVLLVGLPLSQVGEFSFILSKSGVEAGLMEPFSYQVFLAVSIITMAATPFGVNLAFRLAEWSASFSFPKTLQRGLYRNAEMALPHGEARMEDHLIVVGFGLNGRNVARAARLSEIPCLILEMNPSTVKDERQKGEPIFYGDAAQEAVLHHARVERARAMVIVISDPAAIRRIVVLARRMNPGLHIIVRTRYLDEMEPLYRAGADEVIPEEFETSVEIFTRVLMKYLVPRDQIETFVAEVRADGYEMLRSRSTDRGSFCDLGSQIPDVEVMTLRVREGFPLADRSLSEIRLRKKYGITLLAVRRGSETLSSPDGDTVLRAEDLLVLLVPKDKAPGLVELLSAETAEK